MRCRIPSKKGVTLIELVLGLAFLSFVILMGALLFHMTIGNVSGSQGRTIATQEARSFEILLRNVLSKAEDIDVSQSPHGDLVLFLNSDGLNTIFNNDHETFASIQSVKFTANGVESVYQSASNTTLRYQMDYEITAKNRESFYVLKGGIMLNNISSAANIVKGNLAWMTGDFNEYLVINLE